MMKLDDTQNVPYKWKQVNYLFFIFAYLNLDKNEEFL